MLEQHIDDDELLAYLQDGLSLEDTETVEQHVGSCVYCARRLQDEAQLEMALFDVAAAPMVAEPIDRSPSRERGPLRERAGRAALGVLTMAAAVLLTVTTGSRLAKLEPSAPGSDARQVLARYAESSIDAQGPACIPPLSPTNNVCDDVMFVAQSWSDTVPWTPLDPEEDAPGTRCVPVPTGEGTSIACTTEPFSG